MRLIDSVLTSSSFVWFGKLNMKDKGRLSRIVEVATPISSEQVWRKMYVTQQTIKLLCCVESCRVRVVSCRVVSCRVVSCRAVPCRAVPCRAVPCRAVPCRAVPCRARFTFYRRSHLLLARSIAGVLSHVLIVSLVHTELVHNQTEPDCHQYLHASNGMWSRKYSKRLIRSPKKFQSSNFYE